ncbi:MAG TPA: class I SAM-dependent methyltransferase [Baekduia sp.]|nr:class I SAM-dependent methyltransferase [Baekduia sp.]
MSAVPVVDRDGTAVAACEPRTACAVCGAGPLEPRLEVPRVPVHMGCTERPAGADAYADQRWVVCAACASLQLGAMAPLDLVYQAQHNAAVGGVWARHHAAFAAFVAGFGPRRVVEVGGSTGALARAYVAAHDVDAWTVVEPNPTFVPERPIELVQAFVEDAADTVAGADAVVHSHLLEHLYTPRDFLRTVRSQVADGGLMILSVPDIESLLAQHSGSNALNFEHTYQFGIPALLWMLADAGFELEALRRFGRHSIFVAAVAKDAPGAAGPAPAGDHGAAFARFVEDARADAAALTGRAAAYDGDVYLFGGHVFSQFIIGCGFDAGRATGVLDNDPAKQGLRLYGTDLMVSAPAAVADAGAVAVIVRAAHYTGEITEQLRGLSSAIEVW